MIAGLVDPVGRLFITTTAPGTTSTLLGGISHLTTGEVHVSTDTPVHFVNGFGVTSIGQLCISPAGVIADYQQGLPFDSSGLLVTQADVDPVATDPYVGGIRVGASSGVYTTSATPTVVSSFSVGFDEGFA